MPIHLYAEHLLNIHTLTIQASLDSDSNESTRAVLDPADKLLTLTHKGECNSIPLPVNDPLQSETDGLRPLELLSSPSKDLTFRVRLESASPLRCNGGPIGADVRNVLPWTAGQLGKSTKLSCSTCSATIIARDHVETWKDLPSETWAEMMDFWHCHKPDPPEDQNHCDVVNKGYTAASRLELSRGIGLVDTTAFLFTADQCEQIVETVGAHRFIFFSTPIGFRRA